MIQHMIKPVIRNVLSERNDYILSNDEAEIDEETEKALKKMDWDKTVKGEA